MTNLDAPPSEKITVTHEFYLEIDARTYLRAKKLRVALDEVHQEIRKLLKYHDIENIHVKETLYIIQGIVRKELEYFEE